VGSGVGGGIALFDSPALLERNVFEANSANQGGALYARGCSLLVVRGNHAVHNAADEDGGAFLFDLHTHGWVEFNVVERNQAAWGGGMSLGRLSGMAVSNNTVVGNYAGQWGGGIFIVDSRPLLVRNLVAENRSNFKGGGIAGGRAAFPDLRCNVAWHNVPNNYLSGEDSTETPGEGAVSEADPLFCNYLAGDFHPSPDGPAANGMCGVVGALPADCPRIQKILR
jgi:predicted outer membrane repeat protein